MKHMLYQAARFAPVTSECFSADLAPSFPPFQLKIYLAVSRQSNYRTEQSWRTSGAPWTSWFTWVDKRTPFVSEITAMRGFDNEGNECKLDALNP